MSRARTRCARIEERTLRIGFGIKRASQREVGLPEFLAFQPALDGREPIPFGPFACNQLFRLNHAKWITDLSFRVNLISFFGKLPRLFFHPLLQRLFLGDALFGGVFASSSVIFIEQKCAAILQAMKTDWKEFSWQGGGVSPPNVAGTRRSKLWPLRDEEISKPGRGDDAYCEQCQQNFGRVRRTAFREELRHGGQTDQGHADSEAGHDLARPAGGAFENGGHRQQQQSEHDCHDKPRAFEAAKRAAALSLIHISE